MSKYIYFIAIVIVNIFLGNQSSGYTDTIPAANLLKQKGVRLVPIGVENNVDKNLLSDLGSSPSLLGSTYLHYEAYNDLHVNNKIYKEKQLLSAICDASLKSGSQLRKFARSNSYIKNVSLLAYKISL